MNRNNMIQENPTQSKEDGEETLIANGGYGHVYTRYHKEHGNIVIKRMKLSNASNARRQRTLDDANREYRIMKLCDHNNILKCYANIRWSLGSIALELENAMGGNLQDIVLGDTKLAWIDRLRIGMEIADSLRYLHSKPIAHLDVKSQNILLTQYQEVKLADFGAAKMLKAFSDSCESLNKKQCDQKTDLYCPPEDKPAEDDKDRVVRYCARDVYSFSMVLFEIITRTEIFANATIPPSALSTLIAMGQRPDMKLVENVMKKLPADSTDLLICTELRQIMEDCWVKKPFDRPSMEEVLQKMSDLWTKISAKTNTENTEMKTSETENVSENPASAMKKSSKPEKQDREQEPQAQNQMPINKQKAHTVIEIPINGPRENLQQSAKPSRSSSPYSGGKYEHCNSDSDDCTFSGLTLRLSRLFDEKQKMLRQKKRSYKKDQEPPLKNYIIAILWSIFYLICIMSVCICNFTNFMNRYFCGGAAIAFVVTFIHLVTFLARTV